MAIGSPMLCAIISVAALLARFSLRLQEPKKAKHPHESRVGAGIREAEQEGPRAPGVSLTRSKLRPQLAEIEKQSADPNLWSNPQRSQQVMREKKRLEHLLATDADLAAPQRRHRRLF